MTQQQNNQFQEVLKTFAGILADEIINRMPKERKNTDNITERKRLNGIRGIANYLKCSVKTAQDLKDKNLFPVYWIGSKLYTYSDEVEMGIKKGGKR